MTPLTTCRWLLLLLATALTPTGANICPPKHWFSSLLDACVPCAACSAPERPIILRPCQPHQDTVCGTLNDLEFEWNLLHSHQTATADGEAALSASASSSPTNASPPTMGGTTWDWQPSSMAFAAVACVLFVVALAYILYQHAKQWRHMENMERRFDRDVEQLSAQLMHNIVDLRTVDPAGNGGVGGGSGRHCLRMDEATAMAIAAGSKAGCTPANAATASSALLMPSSALLAGELAPGGGGEVRCVYLEQLLVGGAPIRGNVYTEETKTMTMTTKKKTMATKPHNHSNRLTSARQPQAPPNAGISAMGLHRMQSAFGKK